MASSFPFPGPPVRVRPISRVRHFALFCLALIWSALAVVLSGRAAEGIALRFALPGWRLLFESLFVLFLSTLGFRVLDRVGTRSTFAAETLALPARRSRGQEWALGAAIGWGLALAAVAPMLLSGHLHSRLALGAGMVNSIALALATLGFAALAEEAIFRGYPFRRLVTALGPFAATLLMSLGFGAWLALSSDTRHLSSALVGETLFGCLLGLALLRTHALWLPWGVHFAFRAMLGVVLGLPIAGRTDFASLLDSVASGPRPLTGGLFGPTAALWTYVALLGTLLVLYRTTRDYAWRYTHPTIVPGGYEVTVAPPPAHVAMEAAAAAAPPPLVHILPASRPASPPPPMPEPGVEIEERN